MTGYDSLALRAIQKHRSRDLHRSALVGFAIRSATVQLLRSSKTHHLCRFERPSSRSAFRAFRAFRCCHSLCCDNAPDAALRFHPSLLMETLQRVKKTGAGMDAHEAQAAFLGPSPYASARQRARDACPTLPACTLLGLCMEGEQRNSHCIPSHCVVGALSHSYHASWFCRTRAGLLVWRTSSFIFSFVLLNQWHTAGAYLPYPTATLNYRDEWCPTPVHRCNKAAHTHTVFLYSVRYFPRPACPLQNSWRLHGETLGRCHTALRVQHRDTDLRKHCVLLHALHAFCSLSDMPFAHNI